MEKGRAPTNISSKGFTIVELLIVIVVIGILAAITIVAYNGIQTRARDASRASTVVTLKKALAMYAADNNGQYPAACTADDASCSVSLLSTALVPKYLASVPNDPSPPKIIDYARRGGGQGYGLNIAFEAKARCVDGDNMNPAWGWYVSGGLSNC